MHSADIPLARSRAYSLFSHVYLNGVTTDVLPLIQTLPGLATTLPSTLDLDAAAADHYDLFGLNVFPFASVFLDASGQVGSTITEEARRLIQQVGGVNVDRSSESIDHVGHALGVLGFVTAAEADARSDALPAEEARLRRVQFRFLDRYLLRWLPIFVQALRQQGHPFYTALGNLTLDLVLDHRADLGAPIPDDASSFVLPDPPPLLDDDTGLKDIARYLTTPAWCGLYLSRNDIHSLGRADRLPRGFGARAQMLTNLLRAAVEFDGLPSVLKHMHHTVNTWHRFYTTLTDTTPPMLDPLVRPWQKRLTSTAHLLDQLRTAVV